MLAAARFRLTAPSILISHVPANRIIHYEEPPCRNLSTREEFSRALIRRALLRKRRWLQEPLARIKVGRLHKGAIEVVAVRKRNSECFKSMVARLQQRNARAIWKRAVVANRIAKLAVGRSRDLAYRVKGAALSELLKMGHAVLNSIALWPEVLLSVEFRQGGMLHVVPASLTPEVEGTVLEQAAALWLRDDRETAVPPSSREKLRLFEDGKDKDHEAFF